MSTSRRHNCQLKELSSDYWTILIFDLLQSKQSQTLLIASENYCTSSARTGAQLAHFGATSTNKSRTRCNTMIFLNPDMQSTIFFLRPCRLTKLLYSLSTPGRIPVRRLTPLSCHHFKNTFPVTRLGYSIVKTRFQPVNRHLLNTLPVGCMPRINNGRLPIFASISPCARWSENEISPSETGA